MVKFFVGNRVQENLADIVPERYTLTDSLDNNRQYHCSLGEYPRFGVRQDLPISEATFGLGLIRNAQNMLWTGYQRRKLRNESIFSASHVLKGLKVSFFASATED